jgi:hypothetical protein
MARSLPTQTLPVRVRSALAWLTALQIPYILVLYIATRVALTLIGLISRVLIKPLLQQPMTTYSDSLVLDLWGQWDTRWYLDIARNGYSTTVVGPNGETNTAFFPLYPFLVRVLGAGLGDYFLAGIVISNICLIIAAAVLYRLTALDRDKDTALGSVKYLFLFPSAFVLSGFFSEALFLLLAVLSFYFAKSGRWFLAGVAGFFVALTRPLGVLVIIPLAYEYLRSINWDLRRIGAKALYLGLIPCGLGVFSLYLFYRTGNPLDFLQKTGAWGRYLTNPFEVLFRGLLAENLHVLFGAAFAAACLLLLVLSFRRIGGAYLILGLYSLLVPLSSGMVPLRGTARYALVIFPLYMILAGIARRHRYLDQALTIGLALFQGFLMVFWTNRSLLVI